MTPNISVSVTAPEGLPKIRALLTCKPKDQAELDAIVEACGGPCAFTYFSSDSAHAKLSDGTTLIVEAYDRPAFQRPMAPSLATLEAGCKR